jgi:hypothetical protein
MRSRITKRCDRGPSEKDIILHGESVVEFANTWAEEPIDEDDLHKLWSDQNGSCALSGRPMTTAINDPDTGSIDRKDSRLGYIPGNVQWVCAWVNYMKSSMPEALFFARCKELNEQQPAWSKRKVRMPACQLDHQFSSVVSARERGLLVVSLAMCR